MNLADNIINAVRKTPMKMPTLIDSINADADVEWSSDFLTQHINMWRGSIVRDAKGVLSVPAKEPNDLDSPSSFKIATR